jgi:hypothetical protein
MKLQLWQQYSSNHSSTFTVIGEFPTPEAAKHAADELRAILKKIADWHTEQKNANFDWWIQWQWLKDPTPPEKEIAIKYQVEWRNGAIDWFDRVRISIVLDRFVFVHPRGDLIADGKPFDQLMKRLGGEGYHQGDFYGQPTGAVLFDIKCAAPNEKTAQEIYLFYLGFHRRIYRKGKWLHFDRWQYNEVAEISETIRQLENKDCIAIEFRLTQLNIDDEMMLYSADDLDVMVEILLLAGDDYDRNRAAELLGELRDVRAVEPLITALNEEDPTTRSTIIWALGEIGDGRAIAPLEQLFANEDHTLVINALEIALYKLEGKT